MVGIATSLRPVDPNNPHAYQHPRVHPLEPDCTKDPRTAALFHALLPKVYPFFNDILAGWEQNPNLFARCPLRKTTVNFLQVIKHLRIVFLQVRARDWWMWCVGGGASEGGMECVGRGVSDGGWMGYAM